MPGTTTNSRGRMLGSGCHQAEQGEDRAERAAEVAGDRVKKVPAPFAFDHSRADLLRHTGIQVRFIDGLPALIGTAEFVDWCVERLEPLLPIHRWLIANLTDNETGD